MNTMRVFLHDLLWKQDPDGFRDRMTTFSASAQDTTSAPSSSSSIPSGIPIPNSARSIRPSPASTIPAGCRVPGRAALADPAEYPRLEAYVTGVIGAFANDPRVLAWDLWNEPDNGNDPSYVAGEITNKQALVKKLLPEIFSWARSARPSQPLTSGLWHGDWSSLKTLTAIERSQVEDSDVLSFHNYGWPEDFEAHVLLLEQYHRPILCTEYMARGNGSTFDTILPLALKYHVAAINWGFAQGKTQTWYPWDSWTRPYTLEQPAVWHHDIFTPDGKPYRQHEVDLIRALTSATNGPAKTTPPQ